MAKQQNGQPGPLKRLVGICIVVYLLITWPITSYSSPLHMGLWYLGSITTIVSALQMLPDFLRAVGTFTKLHRALGKKGRILNAGFMTEEEIRAKKLHKQNKGSRFIGIVGGFPLWLWTETHHLIIGPAGSWKTSAAIINFLMSCVHSALITDIKGELWETTRKFREAMGHRCLKVDPTDPENSVKINPLDIIRAFSEAASPAALTYARGMALQLYPDPQGGGGANDVFYKGARNLVVTVIFAVITVFPRPHQNLAMVYRALSDLDVLHDLLDAASKSSSLNGEIADMARSAYQMAFGEGGNAKNFESFRINALQALEAFGPGNYLAAITSETTLQFSELKEGPVSLYILIDYANSSVLGQFAGLLQWMAADAMVRAKNNKPVIFYLDEFCNAPMHTLPKVLTLLRSAGIKVVMATQDLDDIARVYGKHALTTVLSEAHIKQLLGGIRSFETLKYLSSYLGEFSEISSSYSMGDDIQESVNRTNRRVLTEDELRRLPSDAQIVIYGSERPILAKKVQVFAIAPWRRKLDVNTIYGNKRKLLPVEVKVGWFSTRVTARGQRLYRKMQREVIRPDRAKRRLLAQLFTRLLPGSSLVLILAAIFAIGAFGLPNLRWEYAYRGSARDTPTSYLWCRYIGPTSPGTLQGLHCPIILWRKLR
ncbi:type IV secretory system conjugative DNA transfer family protein [Roseibium algae]|uniref:Type IV secretory system conjugative DNA transfer family protein n=1 Tax=Roseibium algae TaxID=3123038 RepID=A0ABU8TFD7_9HYPH